MTHETVRLEVRALASWWERLRGLIGRTPPAPGQAVWITPCRQVHTLGMAYPIDVVHLDHEGRVLGTKTLRPWRIGGYFFRATGVLEMRAGEAERLGIKKGIRIGLVQTDTS